MFFFSAKDEIVEKVIHFISSDSITINIQLIFEFYHLAVFLQIESLRQICLDHLTLNLYKKNFTPTAGLDNDASLFKQTI